MDEHESNPEPDTIEITRRTVIETGTTALLLTTLPRRSNFRSMAALMR